MSHFPKYFTHTQDYYRFIILKKIQELGFVELPINSKDQVLMDDMLETMYHANGIGLAAIQIGVPKRIIVMDISKNSEKLWK